MKLRGWTAYASYIDINWIKGLYKNTGIDFIYSPFVIMFHLLKGNSIKSKQTLYMLNLVDSFALAIFEGKTLLFGAFFKVSDDSGMDSGDADDWEHDSAK